MQSALGLNAAPCIAEILYEVGFLVASQYEVNAIYSADRLRFKLSVAPSHHNERPRMLPTSVTEQVFIMQMSACSPRSTVRTPMSCSIRPNVEVSEKFSLQPSVKYAAVLPWKAEVSIIFYSNVQCNACKGTAIQGHCKTNADKIRLFFLFQPIRKSLYICQKTSWMYMF